MTIELRLILTEDGQPDRTQAYCISREQFENVRIPTDLGPLHSPGIINLLTRREQGRLLVDAARMLGESIADFRDDRDGFNGERRAAIIDEMERRQS